MTDLFFHLLPGSDISDWLVWVSKTPWLKVCNANLIAQAQTNGAKVFWRPCFLPADDGEGDCGDGVLWGQRVADQIAANGHRWPDAISYRNEINPTIVNAAQYRRYRTVLRAAGYTGPVVYGSFGVGRPDWTEYASIPFDADALELHEYFGRTVAGSPDLALRHVEAIRLGLIPATLPIFIGECGADRCGDGMDGRGWRDKLTPEQYATQLTIYRAGCAPSVVAAFVFSDGDNGDPAWDSFKTRGTPVETAIRATWPNTPPQSGQDGAGDTGTLKEAPMTLLGIDISSLQPNTDWQQVAQTHQFAFIKATEGSGYPNPQFGRDWAGARAAGVIRGCYHFARPDLGNTAQAEADYFLSVVGPLSPGDLLALDLEVGDGDLSGWALAWLQRVEQRTGYKPFLYSYPNFISTRGLGTSALAAYPLWYASYQANWPPLPGRWSSVTLWQHSDNVTVAGVAGIVDESYSTLTADQLRALGKPAPVAVQGATVDALTYYQQLGVKIDQTHAIYTACLKPMYDHWDQHKADVVDGVPIGDLIKPGPLTYPEYGTIHGNGQPAACVKLSNRIAGVYQDADGSWNHPYQANLP